MYNIYMHILVYICIYIFIMKGIICVGVVAPQIESNCSTTNNLQSKSPHNLLHIQIENKLLLETFINYFNIMLFL